MDIAFEDGEEPPDEWLQDGFLVLLDADGVAARLRRRLASFRRPPFKADDLIQLDGHAWDWVWWLHVKLARGERSLVYVELAKFFENIVVPAHNALAGEPRAGCYGLDRRLRLAGVAELEERSPETRRRRISIARCWPW